MRLLSMTGAGVAGLSLLLATLSTATSANPPLPARPWQRSVSAQRPNIVTQRSARRRAASANDPSPCPTNYVGAAGPGDYFVAITDPNASNIAAGQYSAVGGGSSNVSCGTSSAVGSGTGNTVDQGASFAFIAGGGTNYVAPGGSYSTIAGGSANGVGDQYSFVGGGYLNSVASSAPYSFIGGGYGNMIVANVDQPDGLSVIVGGEYNTINGEGNNFIGGGNTNAIAGATEDDSVVGGDLNTIGAFAEYASISGGFGNVIQGSGGFVGAGGSMIAGNTVSATDAFIGGGDSNVATAPGAFVGSGGTLEGNSQPDGRRTNLRKTRAAASPNIMKVSATGNLAGGQDSFLGAGDQNRVTGLASFLGGGYENSSAALESFLGGGELNVISSAAVYSAIVGGVANSAQGKFSAVLGGGKNLASNEYATIIGGAGNTASGAYGVVAGGVGNTAGGELSFAGGYHADAVNNGSFVWSDYKSGSAVVTDAAANQFVARASGGVTFYSNEAETAGVSLAAGSGSWASLSDRNAKTGIVPLDDDSVLAKVSTLPVSTWSYKTEAGVRHVGPMAQDFYAAFGVGTDARHITSIDEDGVALAAIKALNAKVVRRDGEIVRLHSDNGELRAQNLRLQDRLARLEARVDALSRK